MPCHCYLTNCSIKALIFLSLTSSSDLLASYVASVSEPLQGHLKIFDLSPLQKTIGSKDTLTIYHLTKIRIELLLTWHGKIVLTWIGNLDRNDMARKNSNDMARGMTNINDLGWIFGNIIDLGRE